MTRKRLSDVLREAQKSSQANAKFDESNLEAAPPLSVAQPLPPADAIETEAQVVLDRPEELLPTKEAAAAEEDNPAQRSRPEASSHDIKADLQATIAELQTELHAAQQQIAVVQADLQAHQALVKQFQQEREQADQVRAELEQAKQLILKLSAANANALKPASKPPAVSSTLPKPPQPNPQPNRQALQLRPFPSRATEIQPAFIPKMSSESDTRLSDADIGWVD